MEKRDILGWTKTDFEIAVDDWTADHKGDDILDGLTFNPAEYDDDAQQWIALAEDNKCTYILQANIDETIELHYIGTNEKQRHLKDQIEAAQKQAQAKNESIAVEKAQQKEKQAIRKDRDK